MDSQTYKQCIATAISAVLLALASIPALGDDSSQKQIVPSIPLPFFRASKVEETPDEQLQAAIQSNNFYQHNEIYQQIAIGVLRQGTLSTEHQLLGARFNQEALRRTVLPQVTPVASVDDFGNLIGRLQIEQVLFDGGRLRAGNNILDAEQAIAFADYAIQFNERVGLAIDAYFRLFRAQASTQLHRQIAQQYATLESMAQRRFAGGVGSKSELSLFELKRFEAETQAENSEEDVHSARIELERQTGRAFEIEPPLIEITEDNTRIPPLLARAMAESRRATQELSSERAERLPRISLRGSFGAGSSQGAGFSDRLDAFAADVQLTRPLTWGRDYGLKAASSEAEASRAMISETRRDTDLRLNTLDLQIVNLGRQHQRTTTLLNQASERVDGFRAQFLGGSSNIIEAVSIIDTFSRIARNALDIRFRLLSTQREKVELLGLLGPFESDQVDF